MVHLDKYELPSDYQQNEQNNHVVAAKHSISSSRFTFHKVPVSFKMQKTLAWFYMLSIYTYNIFGVSNVYFKIRRCSVSDLTHDI